MKKRVAYLGAKSIGADCFRALLSEPVDIVGVWTNQRGRALRTLAEAAQVQVFDDLEALSEIGALDLLFSVQYHEILRARHIQSATVAVNLHMAPLPEYRGCNQFSFAILNADHEFGTTLHLLDEGVDTGHILFEKRFPIPENCWVETLQQITERHSLALFQEHLPQIISGDFAPVPQSICRPDARRDFHLRKDIEKIKRIDLRWPEERILRHLRATYMPGFSPPYAIVSGMRIDLHPQIENDG